MGRLYFHEKVIQSFYQLDFYLDRRKDKKKSVMLYVLILAVFIGLLSSIFNLRDFYSSVNELGHFIDLSIPDFKIMNGEMVITGQEPSEPIIHDENGLLLIFDPHGDAYNFYLSKDQVFYLTMDKLRIKNYKQEQIFDFKASDAFVYDKASLKHMVDILTSPLAYVTAGLFVVLLHVLFIYIGYFVHYTFGNIINSFMGQPLKPQEVVLITGYSLTIPVFLYLAFVILYFNNSMLLFGASLLTNIMVIGGIRFKLRGET